MVREALLGSPGHLGYFYKGRFQLPASILHNNRQAHVASGLLFRCPGFQSPFLFGQLFVMMRVWRLYSFFLLNFVLFLFFSFGGRISTQRPHRITMMRLMSVAYAVRSQSKDCCIMPDHMTPARHFLVFFFSFHLLLHSALCAERTSNVRLRPAPGGKGEHTSLVMRCRGEEG